MKRLAWLGMLAGLACSSQPGPPPNVVAATAIPAPKAVPAAAPSTSTKVAEPKVWTTPADTDECIEYPRRLAPDFLQLESREQCEQWVRERRCRPGRTCSDGCNDIMCDRTGMTTISTLLACSVFGGGAVEFRAKTLDPTTQPDWQTWVAQIQRAFRVPSRKLHLKGYALPDEVPSKAAARALARRRLEAIRKGLTSRGVDPKRLVLEVGDPAELGVEGFRIGRVLAEMNPSQPQLEDFDPSSREYAELCEVKGFQMP